MGQYWTAGPDDLGSGHMNATLAGAPADTDMHIARHLAAAVAGDAAACFELGVAFSTGSVAGDLVEAHKWFNLAAVGGHADAKLCRAEIADEMTARDIAEAQRRAREWLNAVARKAA